MKLQSKFYRAAVYAGAVFTVGVLMLIVGYILVKGIPHLSPELFAWAYNSSNVSMLPSIINTLLMTILSLIVCVPLGIGAVNGLISNSLPGKFHDTVGRIKTAGP